jgi:hypothetical protein
VLKDEFKRVRIAFDTIGRDRGVDLDPEYICKMQVGINGRSLSGSSGKRAPPTFFTGSREEREGGNSGSREQKAAARLRERGDGFLRASAHRLKLRVQTTQVRV